MPWPNTIPADLRRRLTSTLALRGVTAAEVWGDIRDWLILHGVDAPGRLPEDERPSGPNDYGQNKP